MYFACSRMIRMQSNSAVQWQKGPMEHSTVSWLHFVLLTLQ